MYLPQIHRFLAKDKLRVDSLNRYLYVANNPVNFVDPSGLRQAQFTTFEEPQDSRVNNNTYYKRYNINKVNIPYFKRDSHYKKYDCNESGDFTIKRVLTNEELNILGKRISARITQEVISWHLEFGVGLGAIRRYQDFEFAMQANILTMNWNSYKNEPYAAFGELELGLAYAKSDKNIGSKISVHNILGGDNIYKTSFDLNIFSDLGIESEENINGNYLNNIVDNIIKQLEEIELKIGREEYLFIGWGYSFSVQPNKIIKIVSEEINKMEDSKRKKD